MWKVECVGQGTMQGKAPRQGKDSCQGDLMSRDDNIIMVLPGTRKESQEEVEGRGARSGTFNDCVHESIMI